MNPEGTSVSRSEIDRRVKILTTPTPPPDAHAELCAADRALNSLHQAAEAMHEAVDAQFGPLIDAARDRKLRGFAMERGYGDGDGEGG